VRQPIATESTQEIVQKQIQMQMMQIGLGRFGYNPPKGKGKGRGKERPTASYELSLENRDFEERQRQLEERRNRLNESKGASTVREMLDKAEGPLFTSHPKASHVLGSRVVHAESDPLKDLEDFVADMYREIQEDAMLPGDTPPGERYDPRLRERAQAQLRYPRNTLCRMTFGFDGRRYGEDYLILAKGEQIMWLKEEGGWNFGRKVEPPYQEGWFPPEFARPV